MPENGLIKVMVVTNVKHTSSTITFEIAELELQPGTKVAPKCPVKVDVPRMAKKQPA